MMKQIHSSLLKNSTELKQSQPNQQTEIKRQQNEYSDMTIKGKKNSKVKIIANRKNHNYWGNIFRRKRIMSEYFSDSAFGSQSDTKIEFYNIWEDPEKMLKHRSKRILAYDYDENETLDMSKLSFMNEPPPKQEKED